MTREEKNSYATLAKEFALSTDVPLRKYTSFHIGGTADLLALPKKKQELRGLIKKTKEMKIPITLLGGGTNVLISDSGIRGLVIITRQLKSQFRIIDTDSRGKIISADAGEHLSKLCLYTVQQSLSGLEFAAGIPGTIGGAVMMNAGTKTGEMARVVESIEMLNTKTLNFETIERKDLDFSYRTLNLAGILVSTTMKFTKADPQIIEKKYTSNLKQKKATQPVNFSSAGCFFKNPDQGMSAGKLIDQSGLKGTRINDAMVSENHANFIVNLNNATCRDVLLLQKHIQEIVWKKYHIRLEPEVRVEGE